MTEPAAIDRPSVRARRAVLISAALLYITGIVGSNIAPAWIKHRPAAVLALSSRNRNLFASVPFIDPVSYSLIGFVRIVIVAVVLYLVGRWYGTRAMAWMEQQIGELPSIYRWASTGIDRAGWLLVLLMPGSNLVCLLAGHRRMDLRRFTAMVVFGTVLKLAVLWIGGRLFEDQIRSFLDFISAYQWWLVGGLFALSFGQAGLRMRKNTQRRAVAELIDEVEHPSVGPGSSRS